MSDTASPPPTVQSHDPLPEANWLWRRVFTFVFVSFMLAGMIGIGWAVHELAGADPKDVVEKLYGMFRWTVLLTFISVTYYMVAPSAEQVTRMWQTAALFKQGVANTVTQVAEDAAGNRTTATTTTGPAVAPPAPTLGPQGASGGTGLPVNPIDPATLPENAPWPQP